jgi:hypothetical protein
MSAERICSHQVSTEKVASSPLNGVPEDASNGSYFCKLRVFTQNASCNKPDGDERTCQYAQLYRGDIKLEDITF